MYLHNGFVLLGKPSFQKSHKAHSHSIGFGVGFPHYKGYKAPAEVFVDAGGATELVQSFVTFLKFPVCLSGVDGFQR